MYPKQLLLGGFVLLRMLNMVQSFIVNVEPFAVECFYERVSNGEKITVSFEVMDGGFLDIGITIKAPKEQVLLEHDKETSGKYTFTAMMDGDYTICFNNKRSSITEKTIMFQFTIIKPIEFYIASHGRDAQSMAQAKVEEMVHELSGKLISVKHEQQYMQMRAKVHVAVNENTHMRVLIWSILEPIMLIIMAVCEVYYLKRFFEVKRVV